MKQTFSFSVFMVFILTYPTLSRAQNSNETVRILQNSIIHGIPVDPVKDVRTFLMLIKDDAAMIEAFNSELIAEGKKSGYTITAVDRGNMISYKMTVGAITIETSVWLEPTQGEGVVSYLYFNEKKLFPPKWYYAAGTTVTFSSYDSIPDFAKYSGFAIELMKAGLYVPHPLANRISYNLYDATRLERFKKILEEKQLTFSDEEGNLVVTNGKRDYTIITKGVPEYTFETKPLWGK